MRKQKGKTWFIHMGTPGCYLLSFVKANGWSRHKTPTKKLAISPSSTVHGGRHDTQCVTFELLLHAAFVADEIWGFMLAPARNIDVMVFHFPSIVEEALFVRGRAEHI